ncbi:MAG TPA: hypothetical protein VK212_08680 [Lentimicrobium sp.]|nr:hypothetical protein [Lentimicrobium sp.]
MKAGITLIDKLRGTSIASKYSLLKDLVANSASTDINVMLSDLLLALKKYNNYYKNLLIPFSDATIVTSPQEVLKQMPLMDKITVNTNFNKIFTPLDGRSVQKKKTGGSTGNPFYYYVDKDHLSWFWGYIYFFWNRFSGYEPGDPFITIAGNSLRTNNRKIIESVYHRLQNNYFIKGDIIDKSLQINYQKTNKAVLLYGYPSSIMNILHVKPGFVRNVSNLKAIFTTSEQLLPKTRSFIEKELKIPVYDMYGANDGGILTCECEKHNGYHLNIHNCYVETFENEFGMSELLLTNLNSYSFPLIRYRVGDLGKLDFSECDCGLSWPRVTDLKGRTRDLIKLSDGKCIHGSLFNNIFYKFHSIDGYKIIQNKDRSILLYIHVTDTTDFKTTAESIKREVHKLIGDVKISVEYMNDYNPTNQKFKLIESNAI